MRKLVEIHFERTNADLSPGQFRSTGTRIDVMPVSDTFMYSIELMGNTISQILKIDPISSEILEKPDDIFIFPAKHFITQDKELERSIKDIKKELELQLKKFDKEGKLLEAERIKRRTTYDLAMIREVGYCSGIENYSRHLSGKKEGEPPETLLSYFPHKEDGTPDFLTVVDESHVTLPQLQGMYAGDASRKQTLVEFGFRLPSAKDNRPLKYDEFQERIGQVVYVSATPSELEKTTSDQIIQQIIRPTGLLDPEITIKPIIPAGAYKGQIGDFIEQATKTIVGGGRVLATTLTKKMAEDLASYLKELPPEKGKKINSEYLHSDIKTIDRIKILSQFRRGEFDCLVGVNLLREGLDLPEVELIGILDADKEGFLRSETSLVQTIGRAARNNKGHVILYADRLTGSMDRAINETNRRRDIQIAYSKEHKRTPTTIKKNIKDITQQMESSHGKAVNAELALDVELFKKAYAKELNKPAKSLKGALEKRYMSDEERELMVYDKIIKIKDKEMNKAVKELDFETAAILRDEIVVLKTKLEPKRNEAEEN